MRRVQRQVPRQHCQCYDVALAFDGPRQARAQCMACGDHLRAGQAYGLCDLIEIEVHEIGEEQPPQRVGKHRGVCEKARASATGSTVGRGSGAKPSSRNTSLTAGAERRAAFFEGLRVDRMVLLAQVLVHYTTVPHTRCGVKRKSFPT